MGFHDVKAEDIWGEELELDINSFIENAKMQIGYRFSNEEFAALIAIAKRNPKIQIEDFVSRGLVQSWEKELEKLRAQSKILSKRRHQEHQKEITKSIKETASSYDRSPLEYG